MAQLNQRDLEFLIARTAQYLRYQERRISKPREGGMDMHAVKLGHLRRLLKKLKSMQGLDPQDTDTAYAEMEKYGC